MLQLAIAQWAAVTSVDEILYVGDRPEDEQAAIAAGVPFMWAKEWLK